MPRLSDTNSVRAKPGLCGAKTSIPVGREWLCKLYLILRGVSPQSEHLD